MISVACWSEGVQAGMLVVMTALLTTDITGILTFTSSTRDSCRVTWRALHRGIRSSSWSRSTVQDCTHIAVYDGV